MREKPEQIESQGNWRPWTGEQFDHPKESLETLNKLAHSLRSPLNSILGYTQMLLDKIPGEINATQARYLTNIYENGKLLLQTVNEIIVWLNSGTRRQGFLRTRFQLKQIVENVCQNPTSLIQVKNLRITVCDSKTPVQVWGDQRVVKEILHNLLLILAQMASNGSTITVQIEKSNKDAEIRFSCPVISVVGADLEQTIRNALDSGALSELKQAASIQSLPTMKELLAAHGGQIQLNMKSSGGVELILTLPLAKREHYAV